MPAFQLTPALVGALIGVLGAGLGWPLYIMLGLFVAGTVMAWWRHRWLSLLVVAWFVIPLAMLHLAHPHHAVILRYFMFLQPVYLLMVAYGLIQAGQGISRAVMRMWPTRVLGDGIARTAGAALFLGVALMLFVPMWKAYSVEKINNWSAMCEFLSAQAEPGDFIMGDGHVPGVLYWCFGANSAGRTANPGSYTLAQLIESQRNIWYVNVDGGAPDIGRVRQGFKEIPRSVWGKHDLQPDLWMDNQMPWPQSEALATLYYYKAPQAPQNLQFHDIHGSQGAPDYAEIPGGRHYYSRLGLPSVRPRVLRITYLNLPGRALDVIVGGTLLTRLKADAKLSPWAPVDIPLPANIPDTFVVDLFNPGIETSAVTQLQVRYVGDPPAKAPGAP